MTAALEGTVTLGKRSGKSSVQLVYGQIQKKGPPPQAVPLTATA